MNMGLLEYVIAVTGVIGAAVLAYLAWTAAFNAVSALCEGFMMWKARKK